MGRAKIAITIDENALAEIDAMVERGVYANRSRAVESAVEERIAKHRRTRLASECARLDPEGEQALADEPLNGEVEWPEY